MVEIEAIIQRIENSNAPRINEDELVETCIASRKAVRRKVGVMLVFCLGAWAIFMVYGDALSATNVLKGAFYCAVLFVLFAGRHWLADSKLEKAVARNYPRIYKRVFPKGQITTFD